MRSGGGGQYDMVSASGDASLRLIYGGDIAETNVKLVKPWKDFHGAFKSPLTNTVKGKHYGISLQFGPEHPALQHEDAEEADVAGRRIYDPANKGKISIPDNPIQIADAALYLSKTQPSLKIRDPYELDSTQFARRDRAAQEAAAAARQVLGVRVGSDRPVQERQVDDRRLVAVPAVAAQRRRSSPSPR